MYWYYFGRNKHCRETLELCIGSKETRYTVHGRGAKTLRLCKFTTNHNTQFSRFFNFFINWRNPRQEHVFSRVQKRCPKVDPKLRDLPMIIHFDHFFSTFLRSCFQNPTVLRHLTTPHIRFAKSNYFPNGRTDGTRGFDLPTDVKSASRNKCSVLLMSSFPNSSKVL